MTRNHGVVASAAGLTPFGHMGWGFGDRADFVSRAAEYILDGLEQNQQVAYAGEGSRESLTAELARIPVLGEHVDSGTIQITPAEDYYSLVPHTDVLDPNRAIDKYVSTARQSIADGYNGFRVAVDVTPVARTSQQRDALTLLEYLVDQKMMSLPFSALCGYNISRLGPTAAEGICLHPFIGQGASTFQLYADRDVGFALTGEIDASCDGLFTTTLMRIWPLTAGRTLTINADGLRFISHQQLRCLERYARSDGREVVLRTSQPVVARLAELLQLTNVRVEPPIKDLPSQGGPPKV